VYVDNDRVKDFLEYEFNLSTQFEKAITFPVDIKILSSTPLNLSTGPLKGKL